MCLQWYFHLPIVEGLVSSSNPESWEGGSIATTRVSQAEQIDRVGTRRREMPRRREIETRMPMMPEAATSEKRLVAQANDGRDCQWSYSNRHYHMVWTAAVLHCGEKKKKKNTRLLTFLDSLLKNRYDAYARDKGTVCINLICKPIYQIPVTGNFPFI